MTCKHKLEKVQRDLQQVSDAMRYLVLGRVTWLEEANVALIGGMKPHVTRIGIMEATDPYVIVHEVDSMTVHVVTPDQAAQWDWVAIANIPGLGEFLAKYADTTSPINVHVPSYAWVRRAQKIGVI